jgi:hypothetical protein
LAVSNSNLGVSQQDLRTTVSKIRDHSIVRNDAVPIYAAFLRTEVRRNRLMASLRAYLDSLNGNIFVRSEASLDVIDAAHGLDKALLSLDEATRPYRLLLPQAVADTQTYIGGKAAGNKSIVASTEQERLIGLSRAEAEDLLRKLVTNTQAFEKAYKAFGDAILETYGPDVVAEAARLAAHA